LEKIEFSKGTEQAKALGLRIQFINHTEATYHPEDRKISDGKTKSTISLDQYKSAQDIAKKQEVPEMGLSRGFALKLNKYLAPLEKVF
jgi:hypothetical protein